MDYLKKIERMKKLVLLYFLVGVQFGIAQENKKLTKERNEKVTTYVPNGVWLYDNTFIDQTEIANIHWLEFLFFCQQDSTADYTSTQQPYHEDLTWPPLPEKFYRVHSQSKLVLESTNSYRYAEVLKHPGFRYFPVMGISFEQAQAYSKWRSEVVSKKMNEELDTNETDYRYYLHYRLPTEKEWEFAAKGLMENTTTGLALDSIPFSTDNYKDIYYERRNAQNSQPKYKWYKTYLNDSISLSKKEYKAPIKALPKTRKGAPEEQQFTSFYRPPFTCKTSFPYDIDGIPLYQESINIPGFIFDNVSNQLGIYNMMGNVAEMTATPGLAKGGSWIHPEEACTIDNQFSYTCPNEWLGFRCVCDVYWFHKDSVPTLVKDLKSTLHCLSVERRNQQRELEQKNNDSTYRQKMLIQIMDSLCTNASDNISLSFTTEQCDDSTSLHSGSAFVLETQRHKDIMKNIVIDLVKQQPDIQLDTITGQVYSYHYKLIPHHSSFHYTDIDQTSCLTFQTVLSDVQALLVTLKGQRNGVPFTENFYKVMND